MSKPILPPTLTGYAAALREWQRAGVEWLGLDPANVLDFDATEEHGSFTSVAWDAATRDEPTRGTFERFDIHWTEGAPVLYAGFAHLDYEDGTELYAAIGPRPRVMSIEDEARLRAALQNDSDPRRP